MDVVCLRRCKRNSNGPQPKKMWQRREGARYAHGVLDMARHCVYAKIPLINPDDTFNGCALMLTELAGS